MSRMVDLTGRSFGRLRVLSYAGSEYGSDGQARVTWCCECSCGAIVTVRGSNLKAGFTKSCGCLRRELLRERARAGLRKKVKEEKTENERSPL